jgi:hypothetical protein
MCGHGPVRQDQQINNRKEDRTNCYRYPWKSFCLRRCLMLVRHTRSSAAPHGRGIRLPVNQETPVSTLRRLSMSRSILDRRVNQRRMPDGKGQIDHQQRLEAVAHFDFVRAHKCRGLSGTRRPLQTLVAQERLRSSLLRTAALQSPNRTTRTAQPNASCSLICDFFILPPGLIKGRPPKRGPRPLADSVLSLAVARFCSAAEGLWFDGRGIASARTR